MTVEELIEKLTHYPLDMEVVVQYRDDGGDYDGHDTNIYFNTVWDTEEGKLVL